MTYQTNHPYDAVVEPDHGREDRDADRDERRRVFQWIAARRIVRVNRGRSRVHCHDDILRVSSVLRHDEASPYTHGGKYKGENGRIGEGAAPHA